jgi:hypothetical protein
MPKRKNGPLEIASGGAARLPPPIPSLCPDVPVPAPRPAGWEHFTSEQRLTCILGMSLDRTFDYLAWDPNEINAKQLNAQTQLLGRCISLLGKMGLQRLQERERGAILDRMADVFEKAAKDKS